MDGSGPTSGHAPLAKNVSNVTGCDLDFDADQTFLKVLYGCVFCVGLPTNCLALYGLYRLVKANYTLPVYIINLLLADLLHIAFLPLWIDYYHSGHIWRFGTVVCAVASCVFGITMFCSIVFMCCIMSERYLAIVHPLWFQSHRRLRNTCLLAAAVWVVSVLAIGWGYVLGYEKVEDGRCLEQYPRNSGFVVFVLVLLPLVFVPPPLFFLFVLVRVWRSLGKAIFMSAAEKRRTVGLLLAVVMIFAFLFGPYQIVVFTLYAGAALATDKCDFEAKMFITYKVTFGLLSLNTAADPILYIFLRGDVRETLLNFPRCRGLMSRMSRRSTPRVHREGGGTIPTLPQPVSQE
nr:PREDICTED: G-protein coupled receptor 4-like [Lepisosteus oculatus]